MESHPCNEIRYGKETQDTSCSWSFVRWDGFESVGVGGDGNVDPEASPHRDIAPGHRKRLPTDA